MDTTMLVGDNGATGETMAIPSGFHEYQAEFLPQGHVSAMEEPFGVDGAGDPFYGKPR